jgi:5'-nucleotidase
LLSIKKKEFMSAKKRPTILVTNDDGINAPGIRFVTKILRKIANVVVVAPDKPQSGMGHAITLHDPLRLTKVIIDGETEYKCSGTPVDCVKLGVFEVLQTKPDLVVSGINHGPNSSISVIYSGTMSAAVEGAIEGIPSIGFSLNDTDYTADFSICKKWVIEIVNKVLEQGMQSGICFNVNFPKVKEVKGVRFCRQAKGKWSEQFKKNKDPMGHPYFWVTGSFDLEDKGEDTDEWALSHGYASIVPTQFDMTAHHVLPELNTWDI